MSIKYRIISSTETIGITLAFIYASLYWHDPLSLQSPFPWIWFAPIMIALRYGVWLSLLSLTLLVLFGYFFVLQGFLPTDSAFFLNERYQFFFLGGFMMTLLCTTFRENWIKKNRRVIKISNYLKQRIQSISVSYRSLLLSYERLENFYVTKPVSIRTSFEELNQLLAHSSFDAEIEASLFSRFLNILVMQCPMNIAGIFPIEDMIIIPSPLASIGKVKLPQMDDFLIQECLETGEIAYISSKKVKPSAMSDYLVVAPFWDQEQNLKALLLIQEMPFLALNEENLKIIHLLIEYFTKGYASNGVLDFVKRYPKCPIHFANELYRLMHIQKEVGEDSSLLAYVVLPDIHQENVLFRVNQEKRGLDSIWNDVHGNIQCAYVLMPLTKKAGVENYRIRINKILGQEFGVQLNQSFIQFRTYQLSTLKSPIEAVEILHQFLRDASCVL